MLSLLLLYFNIYSVFGSSVITNNKLYVAPNPSDSGVHTTSMYVGYVPHVSSLYNSESSSTVTPEDYVLIDSTREAELTVETCLEALQATLPAYREFAVDLTGALSTVAEGERTLSAVQTVTQGLLAEELEFTNRLARLQVLYNIVAARSNTLAAWMQQEISVRDRLNVYLNALYQLHSVEKTKIAEMSDSLTASLRTLENVDGQSSLELQKIANAQIAMYSWSYQVTQVIDTHTVKLNSLADNTKIRGLQISNANAEVKKLALVAKALAVRFNEAHLSESVDSILSRLGVVLGPPTDAQTTETSASS